ncbi:MAG TPA: ATP-binding cassette domain-containing protein, partial [Kofleriaceae bacterium]|nr:ATP-binding cassette domain-containing protein [Kofleriaceae bacterium]
MLRVDQLDAAYGLSQVLWGIDLAVAPGEAAALLGRNGVGKTTLLRTILGLHPRSAGRVLVGGDTPVDVTHLPAHRRARLGVGYVPQGRHIFPHLTVEDNLEVGLAAAPRGARVPDLVYELFPVLGEMRRRKGGVLSGGQQQQLAIGRALAARPRLLILDEPTEGVQPSIILQIEEALGRIRRELGVAVLLVEQYLEFAWSFAT